jgi:hypothetical protein
MKPLQAGVYTYLPTSWSRFLLEKLTSFQIVKKLPAVYGTRRFITAFASARHLSLSWATSIQSIPPHPTSWRSILKLSSNLRLGPGVYTLPKNLWMARSQFHTEGPQIRRHRTKFSRRASWRTGLVHPWLWPWKQYFKAWVNKSQMVPRILEVCIVKLTCLPSFENSASISP